MRAAWRSRHDMMRVIDDIAAIDDYAV